MHCTSCGSELPDGSAFCNGCGAAVVAPPEEQPPEEGTAKVSLEKKDRVFVLVALLFVLIAAYAYISEPARKPAVTRRPSPPRSTATKPAEPSKPDLELISKDHRPAEYGHGQIVGKIKNNTKKDYRYVQVTFELLDGDGNTVGTALANIAGLRAGATWSYEAHVLRKFRRYRLQKITGY